MFRYQHRILPRMNYPTVRVLLREVVCRPAQKWWGDGVWSSYTERIRETNSDLRIPITTISLLRFKVKA